jgi:hypothetical protein
VFLQSFFHQDLPLQVEIPASLERVLSEVQHRHSGVLFLRAWLFLPVLLCRRCLGIQFLLACLSYPALPSGSEPHPRVHAMRLSREVLLLCRAESAMLCQRGTLSPQVTLCRQADYLRQEMCPEPVSQL